MGFTKTQKAFVALSGGTKAELESLNPRIPQGVLIYESDTGKVKIGNGTDTYTNLDYLVESDPLTEDQIALLENRELAGGVTVLDENGKLSIDVLPSIDYATVRYTKDIAERDQVPVEKRKNVLFIVNDASADSEVSAGMAGYSWTNPPGDPDADEWVKVFETESLDIDFSVLLTVTDNVDVILEGVNYKHMLPELRRVLETVAEGATRTSNTHVKECGALLYYRETEIVPPEEVL